MSNLDVIKARLAEIQPELERLAKLPGKLSNPQGQRWDELLDECEKLTARQKDLEERERLLGSGTLLPRPGESARRSEARATVARNVEDRSVSAADHTRNAIIEAIDSDPAVAEALVARSNPD
jgi:hypothetical protein